MQEFKLQKTNPGFPAADVPGESLAPASVAAIEPKLDLGFKKIKDELYSDSTISES